MAARGFGNAVAIVLLATAGCALGRGAAPSAPPAAPAQAEDPAAAAALAASRPPASAMVDPNGGRSPAFSPDGTRIAFISSTLHTPPDLWIMNADGTGARRLTTRGAHALRWAPDGKSITFLARRKGYDEVMTVALDGGGERRFPGLPPNASLPLFSSDGKLFAFTAPGETDVRDLWIGTADGARVEAVTEKLGVRSLIWSPESRKIYFEAGGKSYGVGIWEMDLATMESKVLLSKYIGTPVFSAQAGLFAFPFPTSPGVFEVHTMRPDGTDTKKHKAPRLAGRWLAWDAAGTGVYYLGQDVEKASTKKAAAAKKGGKKGARRARKVEEDPKQKKLAAPHETTTSEFTKVGVTALWRLDLATGVESRVSPAGLHLTDFDLAPGGGAAVVSGVLEKSPTAELFVLELATGERRPLVASRASAWMPIPSHDASRIAFFTNEGAVEAVKVASDAGDELASYPDFALEGDTRLFWLPVSDGLAVFSGRGLFAFTEKGPVEFKNAGDHRAFLYADASIQQDKVLLSTVPRYGQTPGLYLVEAADGKFTQSDLRFPSAPEVAAELYLQPRWSLDGKKIAFTDGVDVWTMSAEGRGRARVTRLALDRKEGKGRDAAASFPVWSVKGDRIAYTLTVHDGKRVLRELWVMQADGTAPRMLRSEEVDSQFQVFLPEYTSAPFFDAADRHLITTTLHRGLPNLTAIDLADGKVTALTDTGAIFPAMLPEEDAIVYTSLEGNDERIWIMSADGTGKRPFLKAAKRAGGAAAP